MAATAATPVPCVFPECPAQFRTPYGLRIHQSMKGHQPVADSVQKGDGPAPVLRVRGPAKAPVEVDTPPEAPAETADDVEVTMAKEDHPSFRYVRVKHEEPPQETTVRLADRILRLVAPPAKDDEAKSA